MTKDVQEVFNWLYHKALLFQKRTQFDYELGSSDNEDADVVKSDEEDLISDQYFKREDRQFIKLNTKTKNAARKNSRKDSDESY